MTTFVVMALAWLEMDVADPVGVVREILRVSAQVLEAGTLGGA